MLTKKMQVTSGIFHATSQESVAYLVYTMPHTRGDLYHGIENTVAMSAISVYYDKALPIRYQL